MDVTVKKAKLWVNEHKKRDGDKWFDYNVSCSKKDQDGNFINCNLKVKFSKDVNVPANLPNGYDLDEFSGFFSVDVYTDRSGQEVRKPMIVVMSVPQWEDGAEYGYQEVDEDVPF